ncbi:hypothetical protein AAF712_014496 [Marasmius tenuissimus]|uniref:Glutaminase A central domain-containing protein n=1 Tax=Marasmius tenuissimus TaxID=585030 RepID=A0ABR2ZC01_9AGAR
MLMIDHGIQKIYNAQDKFYVSQDLSSNKFGFSFDSNAIENVKSHWTMFTAATTKDIAVRDLFIQMVHVKAVNNSNFDAFPTSYSSQDGKVILGSASPAQGAAYSLLTLK